MLSTPYSAESMPFEISITGFKVIGIIQRFRNDIPLQGCAVAGINGKTFIGAPTYTAMINYYLASSRSAKCIIVTAPVHFPFILKSIAQSEAHITNDDIITAKTYGVVCNTYTITWCSMSCYGDVRFDRQR